MAEDTSETLLQELMGRYESFKGAHDDLNKKADAAIMRWRYAIEPAFELQVDYFRRFGDRPGQLTDNEPVHAPSYYAYGYDAEDRILYAGFFGLNEIPQLETFYLYGEQFIEMAEYGTHMLSGYYHVQKVARMIQSPEGVPLYYAQCSQTALQTQCYFEAYYYDAQGRMARITSIHKGQPNAPDAKTQEGLKKAMDQQRQIARMMGTETQSESMFAQFEQIFQNVMGQHSEVHHEEIYEYDGEKLKRIYSPRPEVPGKDPSKPYEHVLYEAPKSGETEAELFEAARVNLLETIRDHIRQLDPAKRQERIYNMAVSYDAVADDTPMITLGLETQRQAWERKAQEHTYRSLVLDQGISSVMIHVDPLPPAYERFLRLRRQGKQWHDIRDLLNRVARDLNAMNWDGILNTTDDFIIFASDYEALDDVHDEIRACVPEEKLNLLRDKGLL